MKNEQQLTWRNREDERSTRELEVKLADVNGKIVRARIVK